MRRQRMKGMDGASEGGREGGRAGEGQKERLRAEWIERMIQQRYRKGKARKYMQTVGRL